MNRIFGVLILLIAIFGLNCAIDLDYATRWSNLKEVLSQDAFFAVLTLGVGVLIISGGIDLSIGSVVGLAGVLFGVLMRNGVPPFFATLIVLLMGIVIGSLHGLLVTRLKLQAFLVTLCGLFVYRGLARILSKSRPGIQETIETHPEFSSQLDFLSRLLTGRNLEREFGFPMMVVVALALALIIGLILHGSVHGRYWYAMGRNEQATRYAGINTDRQRMLVYIICSLLASLGGILTFLDDGSVSPESTGETWELYAITGAVLGGCTLRGGEGTVLGMLLGAAVLPLLKNLINRVGNIPDVRAIIPSIDPVIPILIGMTLLAGTIADEFFRRRGRKPD
ncbi:MAG: ABC transporter permease [Planctomycetes bacterium]|nr:ABC transporter permease [Planctomycetota bacterium]